MSWHQRRVVDLAAALSKLTSDDMRCALLDYAWLLSMAHGPHAGGQMHGMHAEAHGSTYGEACLPSVKL